MHPNIFEVFEVMKKEQVSSEMKLEQLELGGRAPPQKKRFIEKDKRISALFKEGQYSLSDFLDTKLDLSLSICAFVVFIACPF